MILVRLAKVDRNELRELVRGVWGITVPKSLLKEVHFEGPYEQSDDDTVVE